MSREKVKEIVDYMVSEGMQNTNCGSWVFDIPELCDKFDLSLEWFYKHNDDICRELGERDELADYEQTAKSTDFTKKKELWKVFRKNRKELFAYTVRGEGEDEEEATISLLAYENHCNKSAIYVTLEMR